MFASGKTAAVASAANYIEDVFSTYLYTGNGSTQTITNGIDLAGKGGLVWIKGRNTSAQSATSPHRVFDTLRGANLRLETNTTAAQSGTLGVLSSFNSDGFSINNSRYEINGTTSTYASWTFRKQPKFFDVVTYTGNGVAGRTVAHNLGSVPGCIVVKGTGSIGYWRVYHRSLGATKNLALNLSDSVDTNTAIWNDTEPTSTNFTLGDNGNVNASGQNYVAYLFAHNAGGFGLTGTDNVISCGSFTTDGSGNSTVTLGYEPQWVVIKNTTSPENWFLNDIMRGMPAPPSGGGTNVNLLPNTSAAESIQGYDTSPTATGFAARTGNPSQTYIYIAIRRGPMKVPTSGTSVYIPLALNNASDTQNTTGFPVDLQFQKYRAGLNGIAWFDRLRGLSSVPSSQSATTGLLLRSSSTAAEVSTDNLGTQYGNTSFNTGGANGGVDMIYWNLRRAPSFFDEVCYTGTGSARNVTHNLGVAPEMMIVKTRSSVNQWSIYHKDIGNNYGLWFTSNAKDLDTYWNDTTPTNTVFTVGPKDGTNQSGQTIVAYLFATCAGVSKVGSYTGTGTTLQVNCGFTGGARFVLIKRTDSTGDWYVWDTARGIVSGNDPYLLLNSTSAEVTSTDYVDTYSAGFEISSTAPAAINASGGTFIFLAIA